MRRFLAALVEAAFAFACIFLLQRAIAPIGMKPDALDFRVVYCAEKAVVARADPYRTEPLRSCERRVDPVADDPPWSVTPFPLPGYDATAFVPIQRLPFATAKRAWLALLFFSFVVTVAAVAMIARARALIVAAIFAPTLGFLDFKYGEPANIAIAAVSLAALFVELRRPRLAAVFAVLAMIVPHIGLPAVAALFFFAPAARLRLLAGGAVLVALSLAAIGPATSLEYFVTFLPLHAHSEIYAANQFSLTRALFVAGVPGAFALKLGFAWYLAAVAFGIFAAARTTALGFSRALSILLPVATSMLGGSFVHDVELAAALPAAFVLAERTTTARIGIGLLALPWAVSWRGLFVVVNAAVAAVAWISTPSRAFARRIACVVAVGVVAFGINKALMIDIEHIAPQAQAVIGAPPVAIDATTPASIPWEWSIRLRPASTNKNVRTLIPKLPDWIALALLSLAFLEPTFGLRSNRTRRSARATRTLGALARGE